MVAQKKQNVGIGATVAALAIGALIGASPAQAQSQPDAQLLPTSVVSDSADVTGASASPAAHKTLRQEAKAMVARLTPERIKRDIEFRRASALFPGFCRHWGQDLQDRETNNLSKLKFSLRDGTETANYTAYGKIAVCESHQSKDGYSIGKITYEEYIYDLAGKTEDEARHAQPKTVSELRTTELFRWDNGKWFY
ncbi:MAG TPA: hypothetical protein VE243_08770 [Candidatus Acidoferrum sp.]|nr:hypothetical protein [Candidatus Acidoferrum sp.]